MNSSNVNNSNLSDVSKGIVEAQELLNNILGGAGNLVDTLTNLIQEVLKGAEPLTDLIDIVNQILGVFSKVASGTSLQSGVLILQSGLKLIEVVLKVVVSIASNIVQII